MADAQTTPFGNRSLSLMARGLLADLYAAGLTTFTLADIQQAEAGGVGRDRAIRIAAELRVAGLVHRTKNGYILAGSPVVHPVNRLNNYVVSVKSDFTENTELQLHTCIDLESSSVVEVSDFPENPTSAGEPTQPALIGPSEHPSPVPPPPSPSKPKRQRNPPAAPEVKALYPARFELTKSPRKGKRAMGVYTKARDLWNEFAATPEQVTAFWSWFKMFSTAAQQAARERRQLNPPMPRQVYEDWPQFLAWWEAKQLNDARERARREAEAAAQAAEPPARASARDYHPFRGRLSAPAPAPVALVASGRAT